LPQHSNIINEPDGQFCSGGPSVARVGRLPEIAVHPDQHHHRVLVVIAALLGGVKASNTLMSRYEEASLNDEFGQETTGRGMYLRVARAMLFENFLGVGSITGPTGSAQMPTGLI